MIEMSIEGLRHWETAAVLVPIRTLTNQRRYRVPDLRALFSETPEVHRGSRCILYACVSTKNNKKLEIWIGNWGGSPHSPRSNNGR